MPIVQNPLAANFRGLNRIVAPNRLDASESPDTTDARPASRKMGALGPRLGRLRVLIDATFQTSAPRTQRLANLRGYGQLNVPFGVYRILPDANGTWYNSGAAQITTVQLTTNVVTLTFGAPHGLQAGNGVYVELDAADSDYSTVSFMEGLQTVASVPSTTTLTFAKTHADVGSTSIAGHGYLGGMSDAKVRFLQYGMRLYALNGREAMRTMDGIGFTKAGIVNDSFTPTITYSGTGLTGTYRYYVVACNNGHRDLQGRAVEGIPFGPSAAATPSNQGVVVGSIPASALDPQVTHWNIYRNKTGVYDTDVLDEEQDFFYVGQVAVGATSYTDTATDASLTSAERLRFNQIQPPCCKFGAIYGERMFVAGHDAITTGTATVNADTTLIDFSGVTHSDGVVGCYFRKDGDPNIYVISKQVTTTQLKLTSAYSGALSGGTYAIFRYPWEINFSEFGDMEGWGRAGEIYRNKLWIPGFAAITGIKAYQGRLLVFTADAIYAIEGKGPNREDVRLIPDPLYRGLGTMSHDTIVEVDNELHFLSWRGPARLAGGAPELYGQQLNTDWLDTITVANGANATAGTDNDDVFFSLPSNATTGGTSYNGKTWRYERNTQSWWEETELSPYLYATVNDATTARPTLFYLQGVSVIQPKNGTLDLVTSALTGAVGSSFSTTGFFVSGTPFSGLNLVECYVRIFRAGVWLGTRRIISHGSGNITWSSDTTLVGAGTLTVAQGDTFEIGIPWWMWKTKSDDVPAHLTREANLFTKFDGYVASTDSAKTCQITEFVNGIVSNDGTNDRKRTINQKEINNKQPLGRECHEYAVRIESRTNAVVRHLTLESEVEADTV